MTEASQDIRPFAVAVSQESLDDLKNRLDRTRWTSDIAGSGADYGTSLGLVQRLVEYWRDGYDWHAFEARLNDYPNFVTEIDTGRLADSGGAYSRPGVAVCSCFAWVARS